MYSFFSKEGDYACYFVTVSTACQQAKHVFSVGMFTAAQELGNTDLALCVIYFAVMSFTARLIRLTPLRLFLSVVFVSAALRSSS